MLKNSIIITIIVLMLAVSASAIPPLPSEFYGSVLTNGAPAPAGTVIEAKIFDVIRGTVVTDEAGTYGGSDLFDPRLVVSATEEDVGEGDPLISFFISGIEADQTATFHEGTTSELDLSTGGTPQIVADFSATPTSGQAPLTVQFTDTSIGNPTMWAWDFGDGQTDMIASPSHTYTSPGTYTVTLTASSQTSGTDTIVKAGYITVTEESGIVADFYATPTSGQAPLTVQFTDTSIGNPTMWAWDFGDGQTDMIASPSHTYTNPGTYTVTLTASSQTNGTDTIVKAGYITVTGGSGPVASFTAEPTGGKSPLTVSFTDLSTGYPTSWEWDFGDETGSFEQNPIHIYEIANLYTVTLTVTNNEGSDTLVWEDYISVSGDVPPPAAVFMAEPRSGEAPLTVQFTDMSPGTPRWWIWKFGDGATSTETDPIHTYTEAGSYGVYLKVGNSGGADSTLIPDFITVTGTGGIVADFSATPTYGQKPLTVQFTDTSTGNPTMWAWDFGDGQTDMVANPSHTYTDAGIYTVSLTASSQITGTDTIVKAGYITVTEESGIVADFSATPTYGQKPLTVQFTDLSTGSPTMWAWDFGDGQTDMVADPSHTYTDAGIYTVSLTASSQITGTDTIIKAGYITVTEESGIVADFSATPTYGQKPLTVQFTDTSTGNPTMWAWDFGDGQTSMVANPSHTYTDAGIYTVTLTASSQISGTDTITKDGYITVTEQGGIVADFSGTPTSGPAPLAIQFSDQSTGNPTMWAWNFGDGQTSMVANPSHTYADEGIYTVSLTASSQITGTDTIAKAGYITVTKPGSEGTISVASTPSGADVYIDDIYIGTSPLTKTGLTYGEHRVRLELSGYKPWEKTVFPLPGKPVEINATLEPSGHETGSINLQLAPQWSTVYLNGVDQGQTKLSIPFIMSNLEEGTYDLKITRPGFEDYQNRIPVYAGQTTKIYARMTMKPGSEPGIMIDSIPRGASVMVDGSTQGTTPLVVSGVGAGEHNVEVRMDGYFNWQQTIHVISEKTSYVTAVLYPEFWAPTAGYMMVTSLPETASIYVDGTLMGQTPITLSAVAPGDHIVKLEMDNFQSWEQSVTVREGKTSYVIARMIQ